jgi:hypothetical protein
MIYTHRVRIKSSGITCTVCVPVTTDQAFQFEQGVVIKFSLSAVWAEAARMERFDGTGD